MASSNSIKAGEGHVTLGIVMTALEKGLKDAGGALKAFGKGIEDIGKQITEPFMKGLAIFEDEGAHIWEAARKTNMSFGEVQNAANGMRVGFDELGTASKKMDAFISAAADNSPEAIEALNRMGLTVQNLAGLSENDRFMLFADGISRIGDAAQRSHMQVQIFGRAGMALNLTGGSAGVRERAERRAEVGGILSDTDVRMAKAYQQSMSELNASIRGAWAQLGAAAAPLMQWWNGFVTNILITVRKWTEANRPLLSTIFAIGDKLILVGAVIGGLGGAIIGLGALIGGLGAAVSAIMAVVLSPWLLWAVAIGIVVKGLYEAGYLGEGWGAAFKDVGESFKKMGTGISDAIAGGEMKLAMEILVKGMEIQWLNFKNFFLNLWDEATKTIGRWILDRLNIPIPTNGSGISGTMARVSDTVADGIAVLTGSQLGTSHGPAQTTGALPGLTPSQTREAYLEAQRAAASSRFAVGSADWDRALEDAINRRFVEQEEAAGRTYPESRYVRVERGRVVSGGPAEAARQTAPPMTEVQRAEAALAELNWQAEGARIIAEHMAFLAEDHMAGADGNLQRSALKGVSSGTFFADAIAGFMGAGESPQEQANRLLAEQNQQNEEIIRILTDIQAEGGLGVI